MEIESYQGLFYEQFSKDLKKCGCYCRKPVQLVNYKPQMHVSLPLKHIDYQIQIINGLANITLEQKYLNPTNKFLEIDFSFPIDPNSCIYKFSAQFSGKRVQGIVKEKQQAKKQYKQALKQGKQAVYAQIDQNSKDIMNLQIGNLGPSQQVKISVSYLQQLNIELNTFYQFHLSSTISPRYMNNYPGQRFQQNIQHLNGRYTWTFKITLQTTQKILLQQCKSHKMQILSQNQNGNQIILVLPNQEKPNKDLNFIFTTEDFHLPNYVLGKTDISSSVMLSFIPKFCELNVDDAMKASLNNKSLQIDMNGAKGQYIFFLDRSGSMSGSRIEKAKQALILFLRSLPQNTYFNVVSFGDRSNKMFDSSKKFDKNNLEKAVQQIKKMRADMGGTQIYDCLRKQLLQKVIAGYPKQLFLLTDGGVSNTQGVIQLVHKNIKYSRCHSIGIGNGCSQALIKGCAEKGKGKFIFINDNQNPSQKIIGLLEETLTPVIDNVELKYDKNIVQSIVPNPKSIPYILKNQVVNFYVLLKGPLQKSIQFDFSYKDSLNNVPYSSHIQIKPQSHNMPFVDKMAHSKIIKSLQIAQKDNSSIQQLIYYVKIVDKKQQAIKQSVKYQILSQFTAFICVNMQLVDGRYQEIQDKGKQKVKVQSMDPNDFRGRQQMLEDLKLKTEILLNNQVNFKSASQKSCRAPIMMSKTQAPLMMSKMAVKKKSQLSIGSILSSVGNSISNSIAGIFSSNKQSKSQNQSRKSSALRLQRNENDAIKLKQKMAEVKCYSKSSMQQQQQYECDIQDISEQIQSCKMKNKMIRLQDQIIMQEKQQSRQKKKKQKTEQLIIKKQKIEEKRQSKKMQADNLSINKILTSTTTKPLSKNINDIISQQNTDGSFSSQKLIQLLISTLSYSKAQQQLKNSQLNIKQEQKTILITYLIAKWIERNYPEKQYALIIKKAFSFVKKVVKLEDLGFLDQYIC